MSHIHTLFQHATSSILLSHKPCTILICVANVYRGLRRSKPLKCEFCNMNKLVQGFWLILLKLYRTGTQIRAAIPKHLFYPQISRSLYYVARDIFLMVLLAGSLWKAETFLLSFRALVSSKFQLICITILRYSFWCL